MANNLSLQDLYKARFPESGSKTNDFSLGEITGNAPDTSISSFVVDSVTGITGSSTIQGGLSEEFELEFVNPGSNFNLLWNDQNFFWSGSGIVTSATQFVGLGLEDQLVSTVGSPPTTFQITPGEFTEDSYTVNDRVVSYDFDINMGLQISSSPSYDPFNSSTFGNATVTLVGVASGGEETNLGSVTLNLSSQPIDFFQSITNQNLSFTGDTSLYESYIIRLVTGLSVTLVDDQSAIIQDLSWKSTVTVDNDTLTLGTGGSTTNYINSIDDSAGQPVVITTADPGAYPTEQRIFGRYEDGFNIDMVNYGNTFVKNIDIIEPPVTTPPQPANLQYNETTHEITWNLSEGGIGNWDYFIQIDNDPDMSVPYLGSDTVSGTGVYDVDTAPFGVPTDTPLYFRVRSVDPNDPQNVSTYTDPFIFVISS